MKARKNKVVSPTSADERLDGLPGSGPRPVGASSRLSLESEHSLGRALFNVFGGEMGNLSAASPAEALIDGVSSRLESVVQTARIALMHASMDGNTASAVNPVVDTLCFVEQMLRALPELTRALNADNPNWSGEQAPSTKESTRSDALNGREEVTS